MLTQTKFPVQVCLKIHSFGEAGRASFVDFFLLDICVRVVIMACLTNNYNSFLTA